MLEQASQSPNDPANGQDTEEEADGNHCHRCHGMTRGKPGDRNSRQIFPKAKRDIGKWLWTGRDRGARSQLASMSQQGNYTAQYSCRRLQARREMLRSLVGK